MQTNHSLLVFTDLDGTLLDSESYRYEPALPMLEQLKSDDIPVIPVTSKTRAEVETLIRQLELKDPFIVENGSGIFIPAGYGKFASPNIELVENYHLLQLGCTYVMARAGLRAIAHKLQRPLQGFGDMDTDKIQQLTGLSKADAQQAKAREFTEPFVTPKSIPADQLKQAVQELGFQVVVGDRFSHLIGNPSGKGLAVQKLTQLYQSALPENTNITTVGLGNSPNDLAMLETVDIPIIVPGVKGPHPGLVNRGWQVAPASGPLGWNLAMEEICKRFN
ncbi:MAG: HAD-IIB family hydrolase [Cyanothece sp. SIO1E1]|nr:HAD-IIB family hydrolase [Cyanothece sp. SIO1E1]